MSRRPGNIVTLLLLVILFPATAEHARGPSKELQVGDLVSNVTIRDIHNNRTPIPHLGKRVLTVWYNDVEVASANEKLALALKNANLPSRDFLGVGIANLKDSPWIPDFLIRAMIKRRVRRIQQYDSRVHNPPIFTDPNLSLKRAWRLGKTDNAPHVIVIDRKRKVRYLKRGKLSAREIRHVVNLARRLVH